MNEITEKDFIEYNLKQYVNNLTKRIYKEHELLSTDITLTSIRLSQVVTIYNAIEFRMNTIINYYLIKPEHSQKLDDFFWSQRSMFDLKTEAIKLIHKSLDPGKKVPSYKCFQKCSEIRNVFVHSQYLIDDNPSEPIRIKVVGKNMENKDMDRLYRNFIKNSKEANNILDIISRIIGLPII